MSRESKEQAWRDRLAAYVASGLTQKQWCLEEGLPLQQLHYWRKRLSKPMPVTGADVTWAKVGVCDGPLVCRSNAGGITVCIGVARIEVRPGFDANLLAEVVQVLSGTGTPGSALSGC